MSICTSCRLALRQSLRSRTLISRALSSDSRPSKAAEILKSPTWSIRTLLPSGTSETEPITPAQLHHLLRLSALPLPKSPAEEELMITTLQNQLQFVRAVQRVDTEGVEPLRAIRDETEEAVQENRIGLADLKEVLDREELVGHYQRPRRVREKVKDKAEDWDALSTARVSQGRYFVVKTAKKEGTEGSG